MIILVICALAMIWGFYIRPSTAMNYKMHFLPAWCSKWLLRLWGVKLNVIGKNYDTNQQYVVVMNHSSDLDPFFGSAIFDNLYIKYLAKAEILKYPIFGMAIRNMYIPVIRSNSQSREQSMNAMIDAINNLKCSLFIYPEGTRNKGPELLKEFHDGAFKVAITTQVPILVASLTNAYYIMKPRSWLLYPQILNVYIEQPIITQGCSMIDINNLKTQVREMMIRRFEKENINELK